MKSFASPFTIKAIPDQMCKILGAEKYTIKKQEELRARGSK